APRKYVLAAPVLRADHSARSALNRSLEYIQPLRVAFPLNETAVRRFTDRVLPKSHWIAGVLCEPLRFCEQYPADGGREVVERTPGDTPEPRSQAAEAIVHLLLV